MADYSLGTAEGKIKIGYDGDGVNKASKGMDDLEHKAKNVQKGFQGVATVTGVAAGAIAAGIGFAVNAAIDFEKQISAIGAVSGATTSQMETLRKKALQLGADTAFSASDAANAMEELVKAGLSVDDVLNGAADATVALAAAGSIDLPQAATIAANAMNQFGLAAKDLPRVADLIAGAANASAIDVGQFGFALSQSGAVANLVGVKFADLATAIALMGNAGIVGSDAGTSLKTMLMNLQPSTVKQIALFKELGIVTKDGTNRFFDQHGKLKSLADVAGILKGAMKGMSDAQKTMALDVMFGSDAIRAAAVISNQGAEGFNNMSAAMGKVTAADVAKARLDNVAGSIEMLKGSVETAAIVFGSALLPVIRQVADFIGMLVNKFTALDPKWQQMIAFAAVAGAALLGFIAVIAGVGAVIAGLVASVAAVKIGLIIGGIVAAIIAIAAAIKLAWDRSQEFRNIIATLAQIGKAAFANLLAVVRPIADYVKTSLIPAVKEMAQTFARNLQPAIKAIAEFFQNRVLPAVTQFKGALDQAMPTIIAIAKAFLEVAKVIANVLGKALGFIIPLLFSLIGPIFSVLATVISAVIGFIPELVAGFKTFVNVIMTIGKIIAIAVIAPFYLIYQVGKFVFELLLGIVQTFVSAFMAVWNFLWPVTKAVFDLIVAVISLAFAIISGIFQIFWSGVTVLWNALWGFVLKPVATALGAVADFIGWIVGLIVSKFGEFWDKVKAIWNAIYGWVVPPIVSAFNAVKDWIAARMGEIGNKVSEIWNAVVGFFTSAKTKLVAAINNFSTIIDRARAIFNEMKDAAVTKATELVTWVQGLPGKLVSAIGNLGSMLAGAGRSLINGFWDGMKAIWNSMVGWITGKMSDLRGLWPFSPAKWGPFSGRGWVLYSGQALMEGFAEGMDQRVGMVEGSAQRALAGVAGNLPTDFSATVGVATTGTGLTAGANSGASGPVSNSNTSNTNVNINVPLDDLRSIRDVQDLLDFIDRLRNDGRRGLVNA